MEELEINKEFLWRDLNVGFSGGERRKIEILQLKLLQPKYIFLDEIDSGLDVDAFKSVVKMMAKINHEKNSFIIITHIFDILKYIPADHVYILDNGKIIKEGDQNLIKQIRHFGRPLLPILMAEVAPPAISVTKVYDRLWLRASPLRPYVHQGDQ